MLLPRKLGNDLKSIQSRFTSDFHELSNTAHIYSGERLCARLTMVKPTEKFILHAVSFNFYFLLLYLSIYLSPNENFILHTFTFNFNFLLLYLSIFLFTLLIPFFHYKKYNRKSYIVIHATGPPSGLGSKALSRIETTKKTIMQDWTTRIQPCEEYILL